MTPVGDDRAILEGDHVLSSAAGTLVVRSRVTLSPYPAPRVIAEGTWKIAGSTGAYAGLPEECVPVRWPTPHPHRAENRVE